MYWQCIAFYFFLFLRTKNIIASVEIPPRVLWWFSTVFSSFCILLLVDRRILLSFSSQVGTSQRLAALLTPFRRRAKHLNVLHFKCPFGLVTSTHGFLSAASCISADYWKKWFTPINSKQSNRTTSFKGLLNLSVFIGLWWRCCMFVCSSWKNKCARQRWVICLTLRDLDSLLILLFFLHLFHAVPSFPSPPPPV